MIVYEKGFGAFNLLTRFYGSSWPRAAVLALPSTLLAVPLTFISHEYGVKFFLHPYAYVVVSSLVALVLIFRTNLSYSRYWEGRSMLAQMSSKWGDAAIQVISFDEAAKEPAIPGGTLFRAEFVHAMSLMHALAMQKLRGDRDLSNLIPGSFVEVPPEPPVDAACSEEWLKHRGFKSYFFLRARRQYFERYWHSFPLPVLGGVNSTEAAILHESQDRVYLVMCWLLRALVARRAAGGISQDAPIVSRIYQVLSDGMLGYENAIKICNTPFPFPYAQSVALLLHINALSMPLLMANWVGEDWLAVLMTFIGSLSFYLLNEVAREIEEPFRYDPNDIPVANLQHKFNLRLVIAFSKSLFPVGGLFTHIDDHHIKSMLVKNWPAQA